MKDQLISYETAVLAKEKGFRLHVLHSYDAEDGIPTLYIGGYKGVGEHGNTKADWNTPKKYKSYSAPTQSLLHKWLREKYDILVEVRNTSRDPETEARRFYPMVWKSGFYGGTMSWEEILSLPYEEALEKGLFEALKLIEK